jgi:hypothetical protein
MYSDGRFDLVCAGDSWVGSGRYGKSGDTVTFTYEILTRSGKAVSRPNPLSFRMDGRGNEIRLNDGRQVLDWHRVYAQ